MIDREYGKFVLTCDICGDAHEDGPFESFEEAQRAGSTDGWTATCAGSYGKQKIWQNTCPNC